MLRSSPLESVKTNCKCPSRSMAPELTPRMEEVVASDLEVAPTTPHATSTPQRPTMTALARMLRPDTTVTVFA